MDSGTRRSSVAHSPAKHIHQPCAKFGMRSPPCKCPSSPALASPCISAVSAASRRTAAAPVGSRTGGLRAAPLARLRTLSAARWQQGAAVQQAGDVIGRG